MGTDIDYVNFFTRFDYKEVMEELGRTPYCRYICFEIFSMENLVDLLHIWRIYSITTCNIPHDI